MLFPLLLTGCADNYAHLDTPEHQEILDKDYQAIAEVSDVAGPVTLSIEDALKRAVHYNLDARVSALEVLSREDNITLEKLKIFPNASISAGYQGRSNEGASSSRSVISGNQSLEPSISSEQHRRTMDLSINWNMLDVALAAMQARSAQDEAVIARERHGKVLQNIARDVYSVYWRAYIAQETMDSTDILIGEAEKQLAAVNYAVAEKLISQSQGAQRRQGLENALQSLQASKQDLILGDLELKSLLSFSPDTELILTSVPADYLAQARGLLRANPKALELLALERRPEMRETIAQRNITMRETQMEIARTFPAIQLFYAFNQDSNKFLQDNKWASFSASIAQSLTSLVTAPTRYRSAKNKETLEEARRVSLAAAIITQVHLARTRLALLVDMQQTTQDMAQTAEMLANAAYQKKQQGFVSGMDVLAAQLEAQAAKISAMQNAAEVQEAAAAFMNSMGKSMAENLS